MKAAKRDTAQYSRIENGKTDRLIHQSEHWSVLPKALRGSLAELFTSTDELKEINSHDKTLMEKVSLTKPSQTRNVRPSTLCSMPLSVRKN